MGDPLEIDGQSLEKEGMATKQTARTKYHK
jgi:hypothetical protein